MEKHIIHHLPSFLQRNMLKHFLGVLLKPVQELKIMFNSFTSDALYKVGHNSQTAYLRAVLNDHFDANLRRIKITNSEIKTPVYFYEALENKEVFFYTPQDNNPVYFHNEAQFENLCDFLVIVPIDLKPNNESGLTMFLDKMNAQINYYKLYSKRHEIVFL